MWSSRLAAHRRRMPACAPPATAAIAAGSPHSSARAQIKLVSKQGLLAASPATFAGSAELTEGALADALSEAHR